MEILVFIVFIVAMIMLDPYIQAMIFTILPLNQIENADLRLAAYAYSHGLIVFGILALLMWSSGNPYTLVEYLIWSGVFGLIRFFSVRMRGGG